MIAFPATRRKRDHRGAAPLETGRELETGLSGNSLSPLRMRAEWQRSARADDSWSRSAVSRGKIRTAVVGLGKG